MWTTASRLTLFGFAGNVTQRYTMDLEPTRKGAMMVQGERMKQAYDLSVKAYNAAVNIIDDESTDMGVALAAMSILKAHASSYVDAATLINVSKLQDITRGDE